MQIQIASLNKAVLLVHMNPKNNESDSNKKVSDRIASALKFGLYSTQLTIDWPMTIKQ